uniref:Carboxy-terminal domain RNA polymerase II polypeptide A small phosphatase n=2 Tax=Tetraselmis sp. GSL018 TaxID=582737 RepID=A0A061SC17_9CHLO
MTQWFAQNGFSVPSAAAPDEWSAAAAKPTLVGSPQRHPDAGKASKTLLLMDFDKTVTIADAGETVFAELSPELLPLLHGLEMPASFVSVTNDILAEMQRRGVNRDAIVSTLRELGQFLIPDESRRAIRLAHHRGVDVRILSDCNTVFISHMLTGAKIRGLVREIISNPASFDRAASGISPTGGKAAGHRLVIAPRHDSSAGTGHSCPLCPSNLCKGRELLSLRKELGYERVIYCGDGANDICPALKLEPGDAVCARSGHSLERLVRQKASDIRAQVHFWEEHCDLLLLITRLLH